MLPCLIVTPRSKQKGFTLVELVAVMVVLGVLAVSTTQFIRQGVGVYVDAVRRDNLQQQARFSIERMTRELSNALPGSIRIDSNATIHCIEFAPITAATTYLNTITGVGNITDLDIVDVGYRYSNGDSLAIYTLDSARVYGAGSNIMSLSGDGAGAVANTRTLNFSAKSFAEESPGRRAYIITTPVSYCVRDNLLTRHADYGFSTSQSLPPANGVPLAEHIRIDDTGSFDIFAYFPDSLQRAAIVNMDLRFYDNRESNEWLLFSREVSLRNTP